MKPGDHSSKNISFATSYTNAQGNKVDYYYIRKYLDPPTVNNDSEDDWYVLRYADVLLMYAEALNETGQTAAALPYLNQVRKRVGLPDKRLPRRPTCGWPSSRSDALNWPLRATAGSIWSVSGRALPVLQAKATAIGIKTPLTENNLLFPIPQSQIDINPEKIKQNPGY